jgi:hypothetical protein
MALPCIAFKRRSCVTRPSSEKRLARLYLGVPSQMKSSLLRVPLTGIRPTMTNSSRRTQATSGRTILATAASSKPYKFDEWRT